MKSLFLKAFHSILLFILFTGLVYSQKPSGRFIDPREAQEHFDHKNYLTAMRIYKELLKRDPENTEYNYKIALCYLNTNLDKTQAISYLEKITGKGKGETEAWFNLGCAYQYANRFDDAIKAYSKFKDKSSRKDIERAERAIETCYNGKQFIKFPVNVTFENLGKDVNSEYADYYPFATKNESFMVFTSRKKGGKSNALEMDGLYASDIYMTKVKEGNWLKAVNIGGPVNTTFDEQAVGLSPDGSSMTVYLDHIDSLGNIYISNFLNGKFQKLIKLNSNVNSGFETSGSISDDGQIIFFASIRSEGLGGTDLYMAKKLPNGQWAIPQNLGKTINTIYNEDFPHLAEDGKTLYFSSQGHSSMGGYDLFKSIYDDEANTWSEPQNLGYPINTTDDNYTISFTENDRFAYVSALRPGGMGDLDIWRIRFNGSEQRVTIVSGRISMEDSTQNKIEALITATDLKNKDQLPFTYTPIPVSGKYIMALQPGKYMITIEANGAESYTENMTIFDMGSFQPEIKKDFILIKKN
jgi:hypothetical protein